MRWLGKAGFTGRRTTRRNLLIPLACAVILLTGCNGQGQVSPEQYSCGNARFLADADEFNTFCFAGMDIIGQPNGMTGIRTTMTIPEQWSAPASHVEKGPYPVFYRDFSEGEFAQDETLITVHGGTAFNFIWFAGVRLGVRSENIDGSGAIPTFYWQVIDDMNWFDCPPRRNICPNRGSRVEPSSIGWEASLPVPSDEIGGSVDLQIYIPQDGKAVLSISGPKTKYSVEVSDVAKCTAAAAGCNEATMGQVLTGTGGTSVGVATFSKTRIRDASGKWDWYVEQAPLGSAAQCRPPRSGLNICPAYRSAEPPFAEWLALPSKPEYEGGVLVTSCCTRPAGQPSKTP